MPPALYTNGSGSSSSNHLPAGGGNSSRGNNTMEDGIIGPPSLDSSNFDILEWHPAYQSCQRYFLDHAQYEQATQAVCALINIRLPFQWLSKPIISSSMGTPSGQSNPSTTTGAAGGGGSSSGGGGGGGGVSGGGGRGGGVGGNGSNSSNSPFTFTAHPRLNMPSTTNSNSPDPAASTFVSAIPYIRRLIVTGFDKPPILHGFFGDDWAKGVGPFVECERRNYLFAAKSGGWRSCKKQYDVGSSGGSAEGDETVPFMKPLDEAKMEELVTAERAWSNWLCMEDWMVGPRAPPDDGSRDNTQVDQLDGDKTHGSNEDMADGEVDGYL